MGGAVDAIHAGGDAVVGQGRGDSKPQVVTQEQYDAGLKELQAKTANLWSDVREGLIAKYKATMIVGPKPPPSTEAIDPNGIIIQRAMDAERRRQATMNGVGATFLTGAGGLKGLAPTYNPMAGGS
jgi:hypothetical protein